MGQRTIERSPRFHLTSNGIGICGNDFPLQDAGSFCLQIFLKDVTSDFDGTFQLTVSNEADPQTNHVPVADIAGVSYSVHATGSAQLTYMIFAGAGQGVPAAQWANLKYTKGAASQGTLDRVIFSLGA